MPAWVASEKLPSAQGTNPRAARLLDDRTLLVVHSDWSQIVATRSDRGGSVLAAAVIPSTLSHGLESLAIDGFGGIYVQTS